MCQTTEYDEFLAVVRADEELLRAEFEAIIDACWAEPPPGRSMRPTPPPGPDGHSMACQQRHPPKMTALPRRRRVARQRSPPHDHHSFRDCPKRCDEKGE
jgi:hypothetical protein